jgi:hypothetical protein|tara:strand:- start:600 stop:1040 length:441 start_codon:yes stop_codon:yes gene_type:complete
MAYKGKFRPKYPAKYRGDPTNIIYRSLWERNCMRYFDQNPNVLKWSSEEVIVPYKSPIDGRYHRYFPDFLIRVKNKQGVLETIMIEVKPFKETKEPKPQTRLTKKYLYEVKTWGINKSKWEAAIEFCKDRKWKFMIITEKELGIKY